MESAKTNEPELTSTMGSLLSTSKEEKNDASDSTPTSSTDAFTTTSTSQIAADDPISSTSSDILDSKKTDKVNNVLQSCSNSAVNPSPIMASLKSISVEDRTSSFVSEKDLLDMNITDTSTEKITENVDDIVQDLENLLGEPTTTFDFTIRTNKRSTTACQPKEIPMDLDDFSVEFQMPEESPKEVTTESRSTFMGDCQNNRTENDVTKIENLKDDSSTPTTEDNLKKTAEQEIESTENKYVDSNEPKTESMSQQEHTESVVSTEHEATVKEHEAQPENVQQPVAEQSVNLDVSSTNSKESDEPKEISDSAVDQVQSDIPQIQSEESPLLTTSTENTNKEDSIALSTSTENVSNEKETVQIESEESYPSIPQSESPLLTTFTATETENKEDSILLSTSTENVSNEKETVQIASEENYPSIPQSESPLLTTFNATETENKEDSMLLSTSTENVSSEKETVQIVESDPSIPQSVRSNEVGSTEIQPSVEDTQPSNSEEFAERTDAVEGFSEPVALENVISLPDEKEQNDSVNVESCQLSEQQQCENAVEEVPSALHIDDGKTSDQQQCENAVEDVPSVSNIDDGNLMEVEETKQSEVEPETQPQEEAVIETPKESEDIAPNIDDGNLGTSMEVEETKQSEVVVEPAPQEEAVIERSKESENVHVDNNFSSTLNEIDENQTTDPNQVLSVINDACENKDVDSKGSEENVHNETDTIDAAAVERTETLTETIPIIEGDYTEPRVSLTDQHEEVQSEPIVESLGEEQIGLDETKNHPIVEEMSGDLKEEELPNKQDEDAKNSDVQICLEETANSAVETIEQNLPAVETEAVPNINIFIDSIDQQDKSEDSTVKENYNTCEDIMPSPLDLKPEDSTVKESVENYNTCEDIMPSPLDLQEEDKNMEVPSSSLDTVKHLEEDVMENSILPLVMEDVPDLDMLNAISTLSKPEMTPEMGENMENNDTLLGSSNTLEEQRNIPFESCMDTALPNVEDIFAEPSDQQLPDDNLETLLAVASLQGVCETDSSYCDIAPFEEREEKIEPLFERKQEDEVVVESEQKDKLKEPLVISVEDGEKEKVYSPRITIKPIKSPVEEVTTSESDEKESKGSLKMTITKQSDKMHSILKIYDPAADDTHHHHHHQDDEEEEVPTVPKLIIKPIVQPSEQPQSPKMSTRSSKQVFSPSSSTSQRSASPRITIKPIVKPPENVAETVGPVKITIKPVLKPEERQKHSPKLTIKPIVKPEEENSEAKVHSPRVTIKPVMKPQEQDSSEQMQSPRITIKPIVKPETLTESISSSTPRVTIKPVVKPQDEVVVVEKSSPKITIKPIVKPEVDVQSEDFEDSVKERIVLKINKGTIPTSSKEQRKRDNMEEEVTKTPKIKLKFSKEGGHPHIVQNESSSKRVLEQQVEHDKVVKRQKFETENFLPGVTITPIGPAHSKLKEMLSKSSVVEEDDDDVTIVEDPLANKPSPIVISEESNQDSINVEMRDPISEIPVFEITPDSVKTINPQPVVAQVTEAPPVLPAPRKRGRPRKVPLQVREDFKDPKEEEVKQPVVVVESTRPKRSCRGQSVRTTLGIKPRKPRGPGRGRGGKRGMGTRSTPTPPETPTKSAKEPKLSAAKLKTLKEDLLLLTDKTEVKQIEIDDGFNKSPSILAPPTPQTDNSITDRADIVMYEEETRMSAETTSRAQTPAKQVVSSIPSVDLVEESQSSVHSVQSTATTESVKVRKGPRLEVHQEPEGAVISADQLAEYYWMGGGPFMLQEQVAQFLGIKSFKRKYPNIPRRVVDMQERDFIRESGLAGEAMCDLGLTAVNSSDILDIMYSDFQDKYEEYCKHQRDRQAKDLTNKQKALSLAASQEKTKMDITQQAVQSAATWNANFNKARRDQRKACMDLQTLTVHFPKGKMKQINKPKIGNYPVALVPGQFTDYYREFTPTEINNLPLNTMCYDTIMRGGGAPEMECDSQTDGSGSESESTTSDSDSSYSGSSDAEDCTLCHKAPPKRVAAAQ